MPTFCCKLSVVDSSATSVAHIREGDRQTEMDRYLRLHGLQFSQVMFCFQDAGDDCKSHSLTSSILPPLQLICDAGDLITASASSIDNVATNSASPSYENVLSASFNDILTAAVDTSAARTKKHTSEAKGWPCSSCYRYSPFKRALEESQKTRGAKSRRKTTKTSIRRRCRKPTRS